MNEKNNREETWYALHVFSGYEQKIERQIRSLMNNNPLISSVCHDVKVPLKVIVETKDGKQREKKKNLMPGYMFLDIDLPRFEDDSEKHKAIVHTLRSIDGVTGFITLTTARNSRPARISRQQMNHIREEMGEIKVDRPVNMMYEYNKGDNVKIVSGSFEGFDAVVEEDIPQRMKLKVLIEIFGRPTSVEVDKKDVEKEN